MKFPSILVTHFMLQTLLICNNKNSGTEASTINHQQQNDNRFIVKFKNHSRFITSNINIQSNPNSKVLKIFPDNDVDVMTLETDEEIKYWVLKIPINLTPMLVDCNSLAM